MLYFRYLGQFRCINTTAKALPMERGAWGEKEAWRCVEAVKQSNFIWNALVMGAIVLTGPKLSPKSVHSIHCFTYSAIMLAPYWGGRGSNLLFMLDPHALFTQPLQLPCWPHLVYFYSQASHCSTWQVADKFSSLQSEVEVQNGPHTANEIHLNETPNLLLSTRIFSSGEVRSLEFRLFPQEFERTMVINNWIETPIHYCNVSIPLIKKGGTMLFNTWINSFANNCLVEWFLLLHIGIACQFTVIWTSCSLAYSEIIALLLYNTLKHDIGVNTHSVRP